MDQSIISRDTMRARGAAAFDKGRGVNDHHMNPSSPAIPDWQVGWRERQAAKAAESKQACEAFVAIMGCPP